MDDVTKYPTTGVEYRFQDNGVDADKMKDIATKMGGLRKAFEGRRW